ncbi:MAG: VWA domain-containing protein, partial [Caulobacterales bacterium]|nr:VWA domain-containing protein [Caulobacterales bacterium]
MRRTLTALCAALAAFTAAPAAEDAILVLDGSGSMWGQVEGQAKIVAAREVVGRLLDQLPAERRLGLMAYGHNRKGDCADIELLAEVGADRAAIRDAVERINPKGRTPLSDAVRQAAEALRYTEEKATVILVSDGKETCDRDPCAVGEALEEAGVDLTTHVIGFDVAEEADRAQLQCLAERTGGRFLLADNAGELAEALEDTVVAPEPETVDTTTFTLRATELKDGPLIESGVAWTVRQAGDGAVVFQAADAGEVEAVAPAGVYDILAERDGEQVAAELEAGRPGQSRVITLAFDLELAASVRTVPEDEAPAGDEIVLYWEGPERAGDYLTLVPVGTPDATYRSYVYVREGNPLKLRLPVEPGDYEARYVLADPTTVLARVAITAVETSAEVDGPEAVPANSDFTVRWTGPAGQGDFVTIVAPDADEASYGAYAYARDEAEVSLKSPLQPGDYELRYVQAGRKALARRAITVEAVTAT